MSDYVYDSGQFGPYTYRLYQNEHEITVLEILDGEAVESEYYDERNSDKLFEILDAAKNYYAIGFSDGRFGH